MKFNLNWSVLLICLSGAACCGPLAPVQAQNQISPERMNAIIQEQKVRDEVERRQFIEITTILRLAPDEQARQIVRGYELFSQIKERTSFFFSSIIYMRAPMPPNAAQMSPEQLADSIAKFQGGQYMSVEAKANGRILLRANLESIRPLIQSDLHSSDSMLVERGLETLQQLIWPEFGPKDVRQPSDNPQLIAWLAGFREDVERVLNSNTPNTERAANTLVGLRDPHAIELLIAKDPRNPTHYYEAIERLSRDAPKNPALLGLVPRLRSKDARARYEALWALGGIDEALLFPPVRDLLDDPDAHVRWLAVNRAFSFKHDHFEQLRPRLLQALDDRDEFVSHVAASGFVYRKDVVAAPTLLRLLKSPTISLSVRDAVADDVRRLMGNTFDYYADGSIPPNPNVAQENQLAVARFEQWIQQHNAS